MANLKGSNTSQTQTGSTKDASKVHTPNHGRRYSNFADLDPIDRLDQSGIPGVSFHHDGPFDVISPKRNSKDNRNAPILAFPGEKDEPSENLKTIPKPKLSKRLEKDDIDILDDIFGVNDVDEDDSDSEDENDDDDDYLLDRGDDTRRADLMHGQYTEGLGSTTFLAGTGAPSRSNTLNRGSGNNIELQDFGTNNNDIEERDLLGEDTDLLSAATVSNGYERFGKEENLIDLDTNVTKRTTTSHI